MVVVHDRAEAWALADRLVVLLGDRVAAEGTPQEVLEHPPTVDVAMFLGFTGQLREADGALRPAHVAIDAAGPLRGRVVARVVEPDTVLCDVALTDGRVQVRSEYPGPGVDERVRLRVRGGVRFEGEREHAIAQADRVCSG
jgi:ABC-type sulfate/molybdate transport systems ATPase subunit